MSTYHVLDALGDPMRRRILEELRDGPAAVGELAHRLPISRPAVSQHLRVLAGCGLVAYDAVGTRNVYRVAPEGWAGLRRWLDDFWTGALVEFANRVDRPLATDPGGSDSSGPEERQMSVSKENQTPTASTTPLVKTVDVTAEVARAFAVFTEELAAWWPLATHSVGGGDAVDVVLNPGVGGQIVETMSDGRTAVWGTVTAWDPPHEVAFTWHPGRGPDEATEVAVRFTARDTGTRVELTHGGWEARDDSAFARQGYDAGWQVVLGRFAAATA